MWVASGRNDSGTPLFAGSCYHTVACGRGRLGLMSSLSLGLCYDMFLSPDLPMSLIFTYFDAGLSLAFVPYTDPLYLSCPMFPYVMLMVL